MDFFATADDVRSRLQDGIVNFRGQYHFVYETRGFSLSLIPLNKNLNEEEIIKTSVKNENLQLNWERPRLGFLNYSTAAFYPMVYPMRQYKQAFLPGSITVYNILTGERKLNFLIDMQTSTYEHMFTHRYPGVDEVLQNLSNDKAGAYGISRTLAIGAKRVNKSTNIFLYHTVHQVGSYNKETKKFLIDESFQNNTSENLLRKYGVPF